MHSSEHSDGCIFVLEVKKLNLFGSRSHASHIVDKLLCGSSGDAAVA